MIFGLTTGFILYRMIEWEFSSAFVTDMDGYQMALTFTITLAALLKSLASFFSAVLISMEEND